MKTQRRSGSSARVDVEAAAPSSGVEPAAAAAGRRREAWGFGVEDANRVTFSLKVGLACLLVSLLVLVRAPYRVFGSNIIWAIMTVVIMFEYTVGATFNRGFNRALGSLLAGVLAVVLMQIAMSCGHVAEPYVIGLSIFLVGSMTSFMKLWPSMVPYEYAFRVILFTYCLIVATGYRVGEPVRAAVDRLYSIAIGGLVAVLVNVLVFPIWAGEQLHGELVGHFSSIADSLEECVKKYLHDDGSEQPEFAKTVMDDFQDEPAYQKCRATLNSSEKLGSLASSAKWEPPHGRFRLFFYPWDEYVNVGAVLRHCAYEVMALHGCLHSEIQAPHRLRCAFQSEILDAATQAAELLRSLGKDIGDMKRQLQTILLKRVHVSTDRLQRSVDRHSYLLTSSYHHDPPKLSELCSTLSFNLKPSPKLDPDSAAAIAALRAYSFHRTMKTKQQRRLRSWPSIEVELEEEQDEIFDGKVPRMSASESTAALSLATFASLLIEFVARLDHLVEAVDKLARSASFQQELITS